MPGDIYPLVHHVHYLGALLFLAGAVGTMVASNLKIRQRAAYFVAAPGFLMAWMGGHIATEHLEHELFDAWHVAAFLFLVISMNIVHWSVIAEERRSATVSVLICLSFAAAVVMATFKPF